MLAMTELMGHHSQRAVFTVTAFAGNKRVTFPGWSNKFGKNTAGMAGRLSSHTWAHWRTVGQSGNPFGCDSPAFQFSFPFIWPQY